MLSTYLLIIYLICLFILLIYQIFMRIIFIKNWSGYSSENVLYIMIYKYMIVLSFSYIVYRKEQNKNRWKSREKIGREDDQIIQITKKKC